MDLSKYTKVEHEDGRIEFIPIKKESEYLTVREAAALQGQLREDGADKLLAYRGIGSVVNLDVDLRNGTSEKPFNLYIGVDYMLEYVKDTPLGVEQYIFKKRK